MSLPFLPSQISFKALYMKKKVYTKGYYMKKS